MLGMTPARCLLIDDHAMFRSGLKVLLQTGLPALEVVEAASLNEALRQRMPVPDVVLLDHFLRGLSGLEGIEEVKRAWPQTPVVMVSSDTDPRTAQLALERGAVAFVSKEQSADQMLSVVKEVLVPSQAGSPRESAAPLEEPAPAPPRLTPRQREVLDLMCQGLPNKAIGRRLDLSENTVRWHVQAILALLGAANRSEAAFAARRQGFIA